MRQIFDIVTSRDFLAKLEADYCDFKVQPDSARHALNCVFKPLEKFSASDHSDCVALVTTCQS